MALILTEDQKAIQEMVRKFAQNELAPKAAEYDEEEKFPWENVKKMAELNLLGMQLPEEYGGSNLDTISYVLAIEEMAKASAGDAGVSTTHDTCAGCILDFGNKEQKNKYLPLMSKGKKIGAFSTTEANAGSDVAAIQSTAVLKGDHYLVNGTKIFNSNGGEADIYVVFVKTDKTKGGKGLSSFIIEKGSPGFTFGKKEKKFSLRACQAQELVFEDCRVPQENRLGEEGMGMKIALADLDAGRIRIGTIAVGVAQAAFEAAVGYAKTRIQFGQPIAKFQAIQFMLVDMATQIEAARQLIHHTARLRDEKLPYSKEAAMSKLFASDMAMKVTVDAVQVFGGYGLMKEYPVERHLRDAKQLQIVEGTNQIQRIVIGRHILGRL